MRPTSAPRIGDRLVGRIGVAIGAKHLRAVGMRRARVAWALESALTSDEPLATALERFLRALPVHRLQRWTRPSVRVVLGARHAQLKRLTGLPPGLDGRQLVRLVQEGAPRFFLRNGHPLVTTGVATASDGARWSAALDADVVDAVRAACRGAGFRLTGIGPAAAVLSLALEGSAMEDGEGEELCWEDEGEQVVLRMARGRIVSAARKDGAASERAGTRAPARPRLFLAPLAGRAARFADAGGAALVPADAPLLHRPQRGARAPSQEPSRVPRWRVTTATLALVLAGCAALLAGPLAASRAERAAAARLAELGPARAEAVRMQRDLAQVSAALAEVDRFAGARRSPTLLLANLARALPRGSALVAVRMDSHADTSGVVLTLLAPRAAPVLGAIEKLPGVVSPQIIGPVTREVVGRAAAGESVERTTLERMSLRFRLAVSGSAAAETTEAEP